MIPHDAGAARRFDFPGGARFAFTILDDTDVATVANVKPVYDLLHSLGLRATKTVWPVGCPEGSRDFSESETLDDPEYRAFILDLRDRGFEITWHGATMETSVRDRTIRALETYAEVIGEYPRIHANHANNRENIYWGMDRFDAPIIRHAFGRSTGHPPTYFAGHREGSPYWWGDQCERHIEYCRNLTTNDIDTSRFNPSMPYHDPRRPLVRWWFSASDAESVVELNALLHPRNQERLEREGGFCLVATHFGKHVTNDGVVNAVTRERLEELSQRNGWFPTVGQLLDWLRSQRPPGHDDISDDEWKHMQRRWALDVGARKVSNRLPSVLRPEK